MLGWHGGTFGLASAHMCAHVLRTSARLCARRRFGVARGGCPWRTAPLGGADNDIKK